MESEKHSVDYDDGVLAEESDPVIDYPILQRLGIVPSALLTSDFEKDSPGAAIVNAPWQAVFLVPGDNEDFFAMFQTELRDSINKTVGEGIALSREHLPVIRCVPQTDCPPELAMDGIENCLRDVLARILERNGVIFVNDVPAEYYRILSSILHKYNKKHSLFLLGKATNSNAEYLVKRGLAEELPDNCDELWSEYAAGTGSWGDDQCEHLQVAGKMLAIPRSDTFKISQFGELLTIENAGDIPQIEPGDVPTDFQNFLERSVGGFPAWYCYNTQVGYHLPRTMEKEIFEKLLRAMDDADHTHGDQANPLLLCGQAYSGKTNILCALAWRMFSRNRYPVIYMPNTVVPSDITKITEPLAYLLKQLEQLEMSEDDTGDRIVPALIVWDSSCRQPSELGAIRKLLTDLRREGRQVQMICSSYGFGNADGNITQSYFEKEIRSYLKKFAKPFIVTAHLDETEEKNLFAILRDKGGFTDEEIRCCTSRFGSDPHFIAMLYQFGELHDEIQRHIDSEMGISKDLLETIVEKLMANTQQSLMAIMLEQALNLHTTAKGEDDSARKTQLRKKIDDLIVYLAFCTFYDCKMPIRLVLRLLRGDFEYPCSIYSAVSNLPLLREEQSDYEDEPQLKIRSTLEAEIILDMAKKRHNNEDCRIDLLLELIDNIELSNDLEVELIRKLVQSIGPNCKLPDRNKYWLWEKHRERFSEVWGKLRSVRENAAPGNACKLLPQELSLIREYYRDNPGADQDGRDKMLNELSNACVIARQVLSNRRTIAGDRALESNITVEYAKISQLAIAGSPMSDAERLMLRKELYKELKERLYGFGAKDNDPYAQETLLEIGGDYCDSLSDGVTGELFEKEMLLTELYSYCSVFDVPDNKYQVALEIQRIYDRLGSLHCDDELFEKSVADENPAGLHIRVIKKKIAIDKLIGDGDDNEVKRQAGKILDDYLLNERFRGLVLKPINGRRPLVRLLIQILWMSYTGWSIIPRSGEQNLRTHLSEDDWKNILYWCSKLYDENRDAPTSENPHIRYLHALAALSLRDYTQGISLLRDLYKRIDRRGEWYLICDSSGTPRAFRGQLSFMKNKYRGYLSHVKATDGKDRDNGFGHVLFRPEQLGWTAEYCNAPEHRGNGTPNFWISVSFSGMEVVRPERN